MTVGNKIYLTLASTAVLLSGCAETGEDVYHDYQAISQQVNAYSSYTNDIYLSVDFYIPDGDQIYLVNSTSTSTVAIQDRQSETIRFHTVSNTTTVDQTTSIDMWYGDGIAYVDLDGDKYSVYADYETYLFNYSDALLSQFYTQDEFNSISRRNKNNQIIYTIDLNEIGVENTVLDYLMNANQIHDDTHVNINSATVTLTCDQNSMPIQQTVKISLEAVSETTTTIEITGTNNYQLINETIVELPDNLDQYPPLE